MNRGVWALGRPHCLKERVRRRTRCTVRGVRPLTSALDFGRDPSRTRIDANIKENINLLRIDKPESNKPRKRANLGLVSRISPKKSSRSVQVFLLCGIL